MVKLAKHELKETATIVVESIYNLNTNKRPGIDHGIENKFGIIWRNKAFKRADEAFDELNKFLDQKFGEGAEYLEDHEVKEINKYFYSPVASNNKNIKPVSFKINDKAYMFSVRDIFYNQGDKTMTKKYNYLVTKVEEYDGPTYYSAPEVLDIFEDKQKAIDYVTELVEKEKEEFGVEPEYPFIDNNSDAKRIYSVDLFYKNDEFPEEDSKTTFAIDRYEVK
jgi:hypothetical protein